MSILSIVEGAYRATLEEQDDAALWFTAAVRNCGSDTHILLKSNAVHYALQGQRRPALQVGDLTVDNPPEFDADLLRMMSKGARVYVVTDDLDELGLGSAALIEGVERVARTELARVTADFDHIWFW